MRIAVSQIKSNHNGRFFKQQWQQNNDILKFDENMEHREPDYMVDDLFLLW